MQIRKKECEMMELLRRKNGLAVQTFARLRGHFREVDEMKRTDHDEIICDVYAADADRRLWQIAVKHHLGDSTLLRYRKEYLQWFIYYMKKASVEAAAAEDRS